MKFKKFGVVVLSMASTLAWCAPTFAALNPAPAPMSEKADKLEPFRGKVEAVDTTAKTLTVAGKIYSITTDTKLTKSGKTITLGDLTVGEQVHGLAKQTANGKAEATMVMVIPAPK